MTAPANSSETSAPLKIALILETSGGGSGRHVLDLAEGLVARGHAVSVIWSPVRAQHDFRARLGALRGVDARELTMHRAVGAHDLSSLRCLAGLLQETGPFDVLHGHSSKAGALVRLLPRRLPGRRIYTPHAFRTMDPNMGAAARRVYGAIERLLAPRTDRIIVVSAQERAHALGLGIAKRRVTQVVNGAALPDRANRAAARAEMVAPGQVAVGFIGRLDGQKDPLRFIEAVTRAAAEVPAIRGVVIGDGPLRRAAERAADPEIVRFLGWRDGPALFPGLDIFCMCSHYEAMSYTLLEALHAGVPVVATAVGGTEETVIDGRNGFVLPVDCSAAELAGKLIALAADKARRADFGRAARQIARDRTVDAMVAATLAVYTEADTPSGDPGQEGA